MAALPKLYLTPEAYLAWERKQQARSEYWNGQVYAIAGASERHNLITANVLAGLHPQVRGRGCRVYPGDMRIHVPITGLFTYADVVVVCGQPRFLDAEFDTLLNPTLIVEVLSKSTEGYDRGQKFQNYRTVESLTEYLLISQEAYYVEHYTRRPGNQWLLTEMRGLEGVLALPTVACTLALAEIYYQVDLPPADLWDPNPASR
jgi:Uma2 family endonuclease